MPSDLPVAVITDAGIAEATAAHIAGLQIQLAEISIGDGIWSTPPDGSAIALKNEKQRFAINDWEQVGTNSVSVAGSIYSPEDFFVKEVGVWARKPGFANADVLFAIWARADPPLLFKSAYVPDLVIMLTLALNALPASAINVSVSETPMSLVMANSLLWINTTMMNDASHTINDAFRLRKLEKYLQIS